MNVEIPREYTYPLIYLRDSIDVAVTSLFIQERYDKHNEIYQKVTITTIDQLMQTINDAVLRSSTNHVLDTSDEEISLRFDDMLDTVAEHYGSIIPPRVHKPHGDENVSRRIEAAIKRGFKVVVEALVPKDADRKKLLEGYDVAGRISDGGRYKTDIVTSERFMTKITNMQLAQYKDLDAINQERGGIGLAIIVKRTKPKVILPRYTGR